MKIYLVVYSDQECYSINKAFTDQQKAKKYCKEINEKELKHWQEIIDADYKNRKFTAKNLANMHKVNELEVDDE